MTITSFGGHRLRSKSAVTMSSTKSEILDTPTVTIATVATDSTVVADVVTVVDSTSAVVSCQDSSKCYLGAN